MSLAATVMVPVLMVAVVVGQSQVGGGGLVGFLCWLAGVTLLLVSELAFLTFVSRLGRFLELPAMRFHARAASVIVVLYGIVTAVGAGVASVLVETRAANSLPVAVVAAIVQGLAWCLIVVEYRHALGEGIAAIARARKPRHFLVQERA